VTRYWNGIKGVKAYGTDCDASLVRWCKKNIAHATIGTNRLTLPTTCVAEKFDLIYAISVFTISPSAIKSLGWVSLVEFFGQAGISSSPLTVKVALKGWQRLTSRGSRRGNWSLRTREGVAGQAYALRAIWRGMSGRPLPRDFRLPTLCRKAWQDIKMSISSERFRSPPPEPPCT